MSRKIFELARDQQEELEMPEDEDDSQLEDENKSFQPRVNITIDSDEEESEDDGMSDNGDAEEMFVSACCANAGLLLIPLPGTGFWGHSNIGCTAALQLWRASDTGRYYFI